MTEQQERPLRFVAYSGSILADIDNPLATSIRAMLAALAQLGHEVVHLEQRKNPLLMRQLDVRGSAAMREFARVLPQVPYRQVDPVPRRERGVGVARDIATADIVLAYPGTPESILEELASLNTPRKVRITPPGMPGDIEMSGDLALAPAVLCRANEAPNRTRAVVVAYDDIDALLMERMPDEWDRVVVGTADLPAWQYLPEVALPERYDTCSVAIVVSNLDDSAALARCLLPLASGCHVVVAGQAGPPRLDGLVTATLAEDLASTVNRIRRSVQAAPTVPEAYQAQFIAKRLVDAALARLQFGRRPSTQ